MKGTLCWKGRVAAFLMTLLVAGAAQSAVITWSSLGQPAGDTTAALLDVAEVSAQGGFFAQKSRIDASGVLWQAIGLTPPGPSGEIGIGQSIIVDFFNPQWVSNFVLAFLWPAGPASDTVDEMALVSFTTAAGDTGSFTLQAIGATTAVWSGPGSVFNLSPADVLPNVGAWLVDNPFGGVSITQLVFSPVQLGDGTSRDADFSIVSITVPEPGMLGLLGSGLFALMLLRRRTVTG